MCVVCAMLHSRCRVVMGARHWCGSAPRVAIAMVVVVVQRDSLRDTVAIKWSDWIDYGCEGEDVYHQPRSVGLVPEDALIVQLHR